jgi:hypothetical protein
MHDQLSLVKTGLAELGCPNQTLAALSGIASGTLSGYFSGAAYAPPERVETLYQAFTKLRRLVEMSKPLPLDFRQGDALRELIDAMNDDRLRVRVELDPPVEPVMLWNVYISHDPENGDSIGKYFARRGRDTIDHLRINPRGGDVAALLSREDAERIAKLLVGRGFRAAIVPLKQAGAADKFEDVWTE